MRIWKLAVVAAYLAAASAQAGPFGLFGGGVGDYGPYTGGHLYSYNTAYGYGLSFTAADSWRRDWLAYPAGITPYRPYERPIYYRAFPVSPDRPPIAVPGDDGLPVLRTPAPPAQLGQAVQGAPLLQPVPAATRTATVRVAAPPGARVWVERDEVAGGTERVFTTAEIAGGAMKIYTVRARWAGPLGEVEQVRVVGVRAGENARVTFTSP
jgi:uncharacterized protein (TIGR03000 family)